MGLPTKVKTWNYNVGVDCSEATYQDSARHAAYQVKEALVSFSQWSVVASSDSASVKNIGDGTPDLWTDWATDLVPHNPGTAHSWIIIENSVTGGQICIDLRTTNPYLMLWLYSATGSFNADGTITDRPSDTESIEIQPVNFSWLTTTADGAVVNCMCSDDGKCTRVDVHQKNGVNVFGDFFFALEDLADSPALWTGTIHQAVMVFNVNVAYSATAASQPPVITNYENTTAKGWVYQVGAGPYEGWNEAFYTGECYHQWSGGNGNGLYETAIDFEWSEGFPVMPIGLFRNVNPRGGGMGYFQDIYWGYKNHPTYSTYPAGGAKSWIKIGCFFLPWDGSTPVDVP